MKKHAAEPIPITMIGDSGAQMRVEMKPDVVLDYAEDMASGATFPPVVVYHDGTEYWLADGFHRVAAARKLERDTIEAEVIEGTARDAIIHGIGSNASHGLRRTQADKRRAVERLLRDEEWGTWSNRKIAGLAKVDHKTVGKIRRDLLGGEFPTPGRADGEIPRTNGKPNSGSGSVLVDLLRTISTEALTAECERRGLNVQHAEHLPKAEARDA